MNELYKGSVSLLHSHPFLVQVASSVAIKAASSKSRYQSFVVHSNWMTVPFSGDAIKMIQILFWSILAIHNLSPSTG